MVSSKVKHRLTVSPPAYDGCIEERRGAMIMLFWGKVPFFIGLLEELARRGFRVGFWRGYYLVLKAN